MEILENSAARLTLRSSTAGVTCKIYTFDKVFGNFHVERKWSFMRPKPDQVILDTYFEKEKRVSQRKVNDVPLSEISVVKHNSGDDKDEDGNSYIYHSLVCVLKSGEFFGLMQGTNSALCETLRNTIADFLQLT
ncbi:MAG TPA: hypothetical protein VMV59_07490 [Candidatus Dormibacteraeota bacterium]|nr:hypothetical protein [Candidatus Dormibacteraeota bacterium]